ncbi:Crp/Fnr family transcriptional regulator [Geminocystis sp. NIES-3709]|uniref:Crp/Fnr family transcriptional regulator n=1 Tax=Geminocystis sp. NIES-3709 TaxID=1617448 RepID=UPI0005FCABF0|nr:Crp/Fnr family transcriptional regulator [Geminocystis sp. NIES-3709]BAQ64628.1 cAMP-binding proteins - catabolite gene activator and regulatory subunit of cAMP-dependent protein kinases [Geminocystis sp. NIES-3709]
MRNNKILENQILASISQDEYKILFFNLENVSLTSGQVIYKLHQEIEYVYFPLHSMISLVSILSDKSTTEIGLIGNEGFVGLPVFLGGNHATSDTIVQIPDSAMKLDAKIFLTESHRSGELQRILLLYTQARLTQISQNAVCKCHHSIDKQFACWLLFAHDSVNQDELPLTQQFIAQMLGVRRSSVTEVAQKFQKAGIIRYTRGHITILERIILESTACECYKFVKSEFHRLLNFT